MPGCRPYELVSCESSSQHRTTLQPCEVGGYGSFAWPPRSGGRFDLRIRRGFRAAYLPAGYPVGEPRDAAPRIPQLRSGSRVLRSLLVLAGRRHIVLQEEDRSTGSPPRPDVRDRKGCTGSGASRLDGRRGRPVGGDVEGRTLEVGIGSPSGPEASAVPPRRPGRIPTTLRIRCRGDPDRFVSVDSESARAGPSSQECTPSPAPFREAPGARRHPPFL